MVGSGVAAVRIASDPQLIKPITILTRMIMRISEPWIQTKPSQAMRGGEETPDRGLSDTTEGVFHRLQALPR